MTPTESLRNLFSRVFFMVFLTIASASAAPDARISPRVFNDAEKWIVDMVTAGEIADLEAALNEDQTKRFPDERDRKLGAQFLEDLLTGMLPCVKSHRRGVRIHGAIIDEAIDLTNAHIPYEVWLDKCRFVQEANFAGASFVGTVSFDHSIFTAAAIFRSMKVGDAAFFEKAVFEGPVDFSAAHITSNFDADEAQFKNKQQEADFSSIRVGDGAFFEKAVFDGPVNFVSASIASNFQANAAQFKNNQEGASFNGMKIGHILFVGGAVFEGPADFIVVETRSFEAQAAHFNNREQDASFNGMKVQDAAFFTNAVFEGPVDFRYADFAWVDMSSVSWPKVAGSFHMQGMTYKYIRAIPEDERKSHEVLLKLAEQSAYTADVYGKLEEFFLTQGYRDDADRAFIAGKQRERREHLYGLGWLGSWLLDWLVGYGRHPSQAGYFCTLFVVLGVFLFNPKKMELQKPEDGPRIYNRFWYSLGLFLPVVNLESDKVWKPKSDETFLRNYMRVHILLGWILIPIFLAALTGLIK